MGRILAIDYGKKRVGLAVTDPLQIVANSLDTVAASAIFDYLQNYINRESVEKIIVGFARQMDGNESESMSYIRPFVKKLQNIYPQIEIIYVDERFTSVLAHRVMLEGGLKKKARQDKAMVDRISATILLQSYMESQR